MTLTDKAKEQIGLLEQHIPRVKQEIANVTASAQQRLEQLNAELRRAEKDHAEWTAALASSVPTEPN